MPNESDQNATAAGYAALSICESLLLALGELKVLSDNDVLGILEDAATLHRAAATTAVDGSVHQSAATQIEQLIATRNALRRP